MCNGTGEGTQGPLAKERGLYLDIIFATDRRGPSYATADGAGLPTYLGPVSRASPPLVALFSVLMKQSMKYGGL